MRSLYVQIAVTMLVALSLSLWAFTAISANVERQYINPVFERMDELELESAQAAWEQGGSRAVARNMEHLDQMFGPSHYLLNSRGIDLVSGANVASFLPRAGAALSRGVVAGRFVVTHRSADGRYWFLSVGPQQPGGWEFSPYFTLVFAITAALCCLTAFGIVLPIRKITATLRRFGSGDVSTRIRLRRGDEIGRLASSFNEMAEHLEALLTSRKRLLEDLSHEIRSPLARLTLATKLARTSTSDPGLALDRIEREVRRITALTSEIVEMTRMEGDPQIVKWERLHSTELLEEAIDDCAAEVDARPCKIEFRDDFRSDIGGDRELLLRAVENILRNAIRYSPELGTIDIEIAKKRGEVSITIRDYGPGVPVESLGQIFEPFFRADQARGADTGGIGLGLSIAKRAIHLHHGTLTAHNAMPGLRVEVCLPIQTNRVE